MNRSSPESSLDPALSTEQSRRRAYKACLHCRTRKARCDLGSIDSPGQPPCARCKRERRECVFAPSFRGGRVLKRRSSTVMLDGKSDRGSSVQRNEGPVKAGSVTFSTSSLSLDAEMEQGKHPRSGSEGPPRKNLRLDPSISSSGTRMRLSPSASASDENTGDGDRDGDRDRERDRVDPQSLAAASLRNPTDALNLLALAADVDRKSKSKRRTSVSSRERERDREREPSTMGTPKHDRTRVLPDSEGAGSKKEDGVLGLGESVAHPYHHRDSHVHSHRDRDRDRDRERNKDRDRDRDRPSTPPTLASYALIRQRVLTPATLTHLVAHYFSRAHAVFPMIPYHHIPIPLPPSSTSSNGPTSKPKSTPAPPASSSKSLSSSSCSLPSCLDLTALARFAEEEEALLTAIVVIASRQEKMFDVHARAWTYMQSLINEMILGKSGAVGAVEALLLLSENLPRRVEAATEDEEHRMAWMLVGMAVRIGYMLGLDQKTLRPLTPGVEDSGDKEADAEARNENERLDRDRLAWTYCYIFDRSISIRSGKAFWSRGPGLCFQRTHSGAAPSASEIFPSLRAIPGLQDDFSAMLQAYTELTQTMASAHDVLYPSKDRTIALVRVGDYHKYLDELTRSINGFRLNWEGKIWETIVVHECIWLTFHYTRLYIYAFAFQAHVQRNTSTSQDGKKVADNVIFPRGPMGSPDARFILEAIDAATELLHICVERLHPSGAMVYLPWRFFLYFQYAGVFLLKAVFVGAVVPQDQRAIVQLVKKVIVCLACASSDDQHAGVRYARLLNGLLRVFSRGVDGVASQVGTPKRRTMDLPPLPSAEAEADPGPASEPRKAADSNSSSSTTHSGDRGVSSTTSTAVSTPHIAPTPTLTSGPLVSAANPMPLASEDITVHHVHSPATEAVLAHLPMPRLDVSSKFAERGTGSLGSHSLNAGHSMHQPMAPDALFGGHIGASSGSQFTSSLTNSPSPYRRGPPPLHPGHHRQHSHTPHSHQQLYPRSPSRTLTNGFNTNGTNGHSLNVDVSSSGPGGNFELYQMSPSTSLNLSQFDLNWPPTEVDGLAQMLADDHTLDGDFWMSLPSNVPWQAWPQAGGNGTPAPPMN